MNIGIVCYASIGGSGVVATELAHALAARDHDVHLISSDLPFRWRSGVPGLSFERVDIPSYPLFREPQYLLALTNTMVRLAHRRALDIIHAHYAVPHATGNDRRRRGPRRSGAPGRRTRALVRRPSGRRAAGCRALALVGRPLRVAVGSGEFRHGGAGGDGLRAAGDRDACRRTAGDHS